VFGRKPLESRAIPTEKPAFKGTC